MMSLDMGAHQVREHRILSEACQQAHPSLMDRRVGIVVTSMGLPDDLMGMAGDLEHYYPASVVKLFTLAHACTLLEEGVLRESRELDRALSDMIAHSSNDAANWVLEVLTGATSGPELAEPDLAAWMEKRQAVNRWLASIGIHGANVCQKTWDDGPYGRERQGYGEEFELRNSMSPLHATQMWRLLASGSIRGANKGLANLSRSIPADDIGATPQASNYIGAALPRGSKLWSKAGWTSQVRHDSALIRLPNDCVWTICIFTQGFGEEANPIPGIAKTLVGILAKLERSSF